MTRTTRRSIRPLPSTLTFTDVDLNDTHTVSSSAGFGDLVRGGVLPSGLSATLASALLLTLHDSTHTGAGSVDFQFSAADKNFDFLADGETLTVTYNVTVTDNFGATSTQAVIVQITGSEDAPVITSSVQSGSATEIGDNLAGENTDIHHSSGAITFNDVDLTDVETSSSSLKQLSATLANGYSLTSAQHDALVNAFTVDAATHSNVTGNGGAVWHFDIADSAIDFLGANDVVTLTFTVQIADGHGGLASQDVVITVHGTEDAPVITPSTQAGSATEWGDLSAGEIANTHHTASGAVTFTDVDLSDKPTSSIANTQVASTLANGYALTSAEQTALTGAFSIDPASFSSTDGTGSIAWHYDIADSAIDFLGANDVVTLTFTVQVDDHNGGIKTQDVVITVHGTEDAPVITPSTQAGSATEWGDLSAGEIANTHHTASGAVTFTDVDLSDKPTSSIANTQVATTLANGYALTSAEQTALTGAFSIDPASFSSTDRHRHDRLALRHCRQRHRLPRRQRRRDADFHGASRRSQWRHQDPGRRHHGARHRGRARDHAFDAGRLGHRMGRPVGGRDRQHASYGLRGGDLHGCRPVGQANELDRQHAGREHAGQWLRPDLGRTNRTDRRLSIDPASFSSTDGTGSIAWHYDIADSAIDFLGANDVVTLTFTVQVDDHNGGIKTQDVVITVHGTEDAPVITPSTQAGSATEWGDLSAGEIANTHHTASGAVTFTDVDLSDKPTSSIANTQVASTLANGYALTSAEQTALTGAFSIDPASFSSTDGTGSIAWHYDIADSAIDFLGANDVVTLTFTVQVDDHNGGIKTQDVVITVHGMHHR